MKQEDVFEIGDIDKLEDGEWIPCEGCGEIWELNDLRNVVNDYIDDDIRRLMLCPECRDKFY